MRYESMSHETKSKTAAGRAGEERRAHHRNDRGQVTRLDVRHLHMMKYCYYYLMTYNAANMIRSSVSNVW